MIIFKLFRYILLYKKIVISDLNSLRKMIEFLHIFTLTSLDNPPINNIRVIANESVCILVNKSSLEAESIKNYITIQITNTANLIESNPTELGFVDSHIIANAFYVVKGLVIKGQAEGYQFIEHVMGLLGTSTPAVRRQIAYCWKVLLEDAHFSKDNNF